MAAQSLGRWFDRRRVLQFRVKVHEFFIYDLVLRGDDRTHQRSIGVKEIERLIQKLELNKEILAEQDAAEETTAEGKTKFHIT